MESSDLKSIDGKRPEELVIQEMEQMVGMTGGAILGLLSLLIGAVGLIWAGINAEVFVKANSHKILDTLFNIQEQLDTLNESITEGFLTTY